VKFVKDIKVSPRNEYKGSISESFMQEMIMKFDKKFFDFESFNEAFMSDFLGRNTRLKHFFVEKNIMSLFRNFLNKYRSRVHQRDLKDQFDFETFNKKIQNLEEKSENKLENEKNPKDFPNRSIEKDELLKKMIKEIKNRKGAEYIEKIKKKRDFIKRIPENFNFWVYQKKKGRSSSQK